MKFCFIRHIKLGRILFDDKLLWMRDILECKLLLDQSHKQQQTILKPYNFFACCIFIKKIEPCELYCINVAVSV